MEVELTDWEKGESETPKIGGERGKAIEKMIAVIHHASTKEQIVAAYAVRSELLKQFPDDINLLRVGSYLYRHWQRLGGTPAELSSYIGSRTSKPKEKVSV